MIKYKWIDKDKIEKITTKIEIIDVRKLRAEKANLEVMLIKETPEVIEELGKFHLEQENEMLKNQIIEIEQRLKDFDNLNNKISSKKIG